MEVEISPAITCNTNNANFLRDLAPSGLQVTITPSPAKGIEPEAKRRKSELTFNCIVCSDAFNDPNVLYEHMKDNHPELYEREEEPGQALDDDLDDDECSAYFENGDFSKESSDEDFMELSSILEPICELRQDDEEDSEDIINCMKNGHSDTNGGNGINGTNGINVTNGMAQFLAGKLNEHQMRLQLELQLQLQNHLLQQQLHHHQLQQQSREPKDMLINQDAVKPLKALLTNNLSNSSNGLMRPLLLRK